MSDDRYRDGRASGFFFRDSRDVNWGSNYEGFHNDHENSPQLIRERRKLKVVPVKKKLRQSKEDGEQE